MVSWVTLFQSGATSKFTTKGYMKKMPIHAVNDQPHVLFAWERITGQMIPPGSESNWKGVTFKIIITLKRKCVCCFNFPWLVLLEIENNGRGKRLNSSCFVKTFVAPKGRSSHAIQFSISELSLWGHSKLSPHVHEKRNFHVMWCATSCNFGNHLTGGKSNILQSFTLGRTFVQWKRLIGLQDE